MTHLKLEPKLTPSEHQDALSFELKAFTQTIQHASYNIARVAFEAACRKHGITDEVQIECEFHEWRDLELDPPSA